MSTLRETLATSKEHAQHRGMPQVECRWHGTEARQIIWILQECQRARARWREPYGGVCFNEERN